MSSHVGGEEWNYVSQAAMVFSVIATALSGCVLGYFYGVAIAALWTVLSAAMLVAMIRLVMRMAKGDESVTRLAVGLTIALIALWVGSSLALWQTKNPAAMVIAVSGAWTWVMHIMLGGQRNPRVMITELAMPMAALLYFLISSAWTNYPFWVAVAATVSALMMAATLAQSAKTSHDNYKRLQKATGEAKALQHKMEFAVESVGDGYFEVDLDTLKYMPNPKFSEAIGLPPGAHDARTLGEFVHPEDAPALSENLRQCRRGQKDGWNLDVRVRGRSGHWRWMAMRARALNIGGKRMLIGTFVDMTERKQLETQMLAAKEAAIASAKAKGEFLANMSHEIRTPLNGVLGMAQALSQADLAPEDREKVAIILDSGTSLMALLNDVLDLSKIEAGKLEIVATEDDFAHAMSRTRKLFQSQAEEKGLKLEMRVDAAFPPRLRFDPVRVRQCVSNLLSNAIKFTARGEVEVAVSARALGAGQHMISVRISDTGIGMSEEAVSRLFGVFEQADNSTTRRFGGTGLGLFISRQLARMMGGDITVESEEGVGSAFTLSFKAQEAAALRPAAGSAEPARVAGAAGSSSLRGVRVLLTDDNAINRQVIKLFLYPHGCVITEAANGKEALDKLASQPFDIVLLDVHMPVMDGRQAIQKIRASDQPWRSLPVIALTADAMSGDRERYIALGMTDYVSKPVDQRELIAKLSVALGLEQEKKPAARTGS
jgi:PAS domain S-box-containing protein